jgi:hypothetical protein
MNNPKFFNFAANWPNPGDAAEISIRLGQSVISRIADTHKGTNRDYFRASSTGLALWFADNWWRLRWETIHEAKFPTVEWRLHHELNSASGGALWPPVMIFSVGDRIAFAPSVERSMTDGPQAYFDFKIGMVAASDYESELDGFFAAVLEHCANSVDGKALDVLLKQISTERQDAELTAWRRLEACLGFDADSAPDDVIEALVVLEDVAGEDGVEEAAHAQPGKSCPRALSEAIDATKQSQVEIDLSLAEGLLHDWQLPSYASPWRMAEAAAAELRSIIGVPQGRIDDRAFGDIFKSRWDTLKAATATARNLSYGARISSNGKFKVALQNPYPPDRRFELARQFADAVWHRNSEFGIVSRSKSDRQRFQRAFANSLLCPFDDLQHFLDVHDPTPEAMESAAKRFGVNKSVVRNQLVYKGYLPFDNSGEEAEAA